MPIPISKSCFLASFWPSTWSSVWRFTIPHYLPQHVIILPLPRLGILSTVTSTLIIWRTKLI
jgi:hypothetical protein